MQNKLQELTDKLYNEGLSKGKEEGEALLAQARKDSEAILAKAREEAAAITAKAEKDAEDLRDKVASDLRMASAQTLQATKKDIENVVMGKLAGEKTSEVLKDTGFIKEIIKAVAGRFDAGQASDLEIVLPESLKKELQPWVEGELAKSLRNGVSAQFSKKVGEGFTIGPKDGGWFISLTDESFSKLIAEYLRPVTRKLLFGE